MKKLLFILTLFISATSFAQTKEETIDWINTNAESLTQFSVEDKPNWSTYIHKIVGIDKDNLSLIVYYTIDGYEKNYQTNSLEYKSTYERVYHIPINSILYEDVSTLQKNVADRANRKYYTIRLAPETTISEKENGKVKTYKTKSFTIFYDNEENVNRVIKAIMHLAKLNGAKENKQPF